MGLFTAIWFILPAYIANGGACAIHGHHPVDGKRNAWDGRRLIGDGVTWGGLVSGTFFAICLSLLQRAILPQYYIIENATYIQAAELGFLLGFGALMGDLVESSFKRRIGIKRGNPLPLLDQWDFLIGALLLSSIMIRPPTMDILILFIITPVIHYGSNYFSYKCGLKDVPW